MLRTSPVTASVVAEETSEVYWYVFPAAGSHVLCVDTWSH